MSSSLRQFNSGGLHLRMLAGSGEARAVSGDDRLEAARTNGGGTRSQERLATTAAAIPAAGAPRRMIDVGGADNPPAARAGRGRRLAGQGLPRSGPGRAPRTNETTAPVGGAAGECVLRACSVMPRWHSCGEAGSRRAVPFASIDLILL